VTAEAVVAVEETTTTEAVVADEETTTTTMAPAAINAITGTVRAANGTAIADVYVQMWGDFNFFDTTTDANGHFEFANLPADTYRASFQDGEDAYVSEWWNDVTSQELATPIVIPAESAVDLAVQLDRVPGALLQGTVSADDGTPIEGVIVRTEDLAFSDVTDVDGRYSMLVPAGSYKLEFFDPSGEWGSEWWQDGASASLATAIVATDGDQLTFDAALVLATNAAPAAAPEGQGTISGRVTAPGGAGIAGVDLWAHSVETGDVVFATTDSSGNYTMDVPAGSYKIHFSPPSDSGWAWEYYDDAQNFPAATAVPVAEGATVANINAELAPWSQITGRVTAPDGVGIAGVDVTARPLGDGNVFGATTDSSGNYTMDLPAGTYKVEFSPPSDSDFVSEYYDDVQSFSAATAVPVAAGATVADINAELAEVSKITGKVTGPGGVAIAGVDVWASPVGDGDSGFATTDSSGNYTLELPAGSYTISFSAPSDSDFVSEYYNDVQSFSAATAVPVAAGATVANINAELAKVGKITGKVTGAGGVAIAGVDVFASPVGDGGSGFATTDSSGNYTMELPAGSYKISFSAPSDSDFVSEYYNDVRNFSAATAVPVAAGATVANINAQLAKVGKISGKVTGPGGVAIAGVSVFASPVGDGGSGFATTDSSGNYTMDVPAGSYKIEFSPPSGSDYALEYYNDVRNFSAATAVPVAAGATVANINAQLAKVGKIAGKVTGPGGVAIAGVDVVAYPVGSGEFASATTDSSGIYTLRLSSGSYKIEFSPPPGSDWVLEYYNDVQNFTAATAVPVAAGATVANINAQLAKVGKITGKVTGLGGVALAGVDVFASPVGSGGSGFATTDSSGNYTLRVPAGSYRIEFSPPSGSDWVSEYYNDVQSFSAAAAVPVAAGATVANINAQLAKVGKITGKVTGAGGVAIAGVTVFASGGSGFATTDSSGNYTLRVPAGSYRIEFSPPSSSDWVSEYYNDVQNFSAATPVTVAAGATVANINAQLAKVGKITGKVTGPGGVAIAGVSVFLNPFGSGDYARATTDAAGNYTLRVRAGLYKIEFSPPSGWVWEYYNNARNIASAKTVTVAAGATVSGISAELAKVSKITGRVVTAAGAPVADVRVTARGIDGAFSQTRTGADGRYSINITEAGSYHVHFAPEQRALRAEWFNNAEQLGDSRVVVVPASTTVPNVNATLEAGGSISGRITTTAGTAISGARVYVQNGTRTLTATTNAAGSYTVRGLAGFATIYVGGGAGWNYETGYWPKPGGDAGQVLVDNGAALTGYNIAVRRLGTIAGTVTAAGRPVANASVWVMPIGAGSWNSATTGADGKYTVRGVTPGRYRVRFGSVASAGLIGEYWKNVAGEAQATAVTVTEGGAVAAINADLGRAATLTGTVTDAAGRPVSGVRLSISGALDWWIETDASGKYSAFVLPGSGSLSIDTADHALLKRSYTAVSGQTTVLNLRLSAGVRLTGAVAFSGGTIEDGYVFVYTASAGTQDWLGSAPVIGGRYTIDHLPTGAVELNLSATVCRPTSTPRCRPASLVKTVNLGTATNQQHNLVPVLHGSIAGRVTTKESGAASAGEEVQLCEVVGTTTRCTDWYEDTGADGKFSFDDLQPGKYVLMVRGQTRPVTVAAGATVVANLVVPKGVTVNGRVTTSVNSPMVAEAFVAAYSSATGERLGTASIGVDGKYSLTKLPAGGLNICVETWLVGAETLECWNNSASLAGATSVTGVSGATINGINFVLGGPYPVRNLKAAPTTGRVVLTWNAAYSGGSRITDYIVEYATATGAWRTFVDGVSPNTRSATITGLARNVEYRFRVTARNALGLGPATTVLAPTVPTAPRSLTARPASGQVQLSWLAPLSHGGLPITDYIIQRSANGISGWATINDGVRTTPTAYTVTGLANGTRYYFRVLAKNVIGARAASNVVNAIPRTVPGAPGGLRATAGLGSVTLAWNPPVTGGAPITDYVIQRSTNGTTWTTVADAVSTARTSTVTGLSKGVPYRFRVAAKNAAGTGAFSLVVTGSPS
jgi:hypothetical protein